MSRKNIVITNHTGFRNRGCEALIRSKIYGFSEVLDKEVEFQLSSNDPVFDASALGSAGNVNFSYLTKTPNHSKYFYLNKIIYSILSLGERLVPNLLGVNLSQQKTLRNADIIIPSGGDIFTSDYGNFRKHASILISSKTPVYLCSHTIGPFNKADEAYFLKCLKNVKAISVREKSSYDYLKSLDINTRVEHVADVAFHLPILGREEAVRILAGFNLDIEKDKVIALSISKGIIKYSGLDDSQYYQEWVKLIKILVEEGYKIVLIPHVTEINPDNNDVLAGKAVLQLLPLDVLQSVFHLSGELSASEFKTVIGYCDALIGTRTHATIASLSQCIPTVSIAYSRKALGIMTDVFGSELADRLTIDAKVMSAKNIYEAFKLSLEFKPSDNVIADIKKQSWKNFTLLKELFDKV